MIEFLINLVLGIIFFGIVFSVIRKAMGIYLDHYVEALPASYMRVYTVGDTGAPIHNEFLIHYWGILE